MKKILSLALMVALAASLFAQQSDDPVLFEINGKPIRQSEFMSEFRRSHGLDPKAAPTACTYEKRQALEEYAELFVNFRTKLEDAYALGLDTTPALVKELKGYRDELAAPYLIDSATMQRILREAYDRNHYTLHAAHILVRVSKNASPDDTLAAYNKAMEYYNRVINGEDFFLVAYEANKIRLIQEGVPPDDPRHKDHGDLGNFTVFDMVYPFESAAYSLEPGQISLPVRSNYGYHIIKLITKSRFYGRCSFQHIWCASNNNPEQAQNRINDALNHLKEGEPFATVCLNYSDDNTTVHNGGFVADARAQQLPPEYVDVLSRLKPGEISAPFQTSYGWHILLLNSKDSIPPFEDMVPNYKQRLARDQRSAEPRKSFIQRSKERYLFSDYTKMFLKPARRGDKADRKPLADLDQCVAALAPEVFNRVWIFNDSLISDYRPLFSIGDSSYNAVDFLRWVEANQHVVRPHDMKVYVQNRYNDFIDEMVYRYADSRLEEENPDFRDLVNEYRNGLMIFSYNDQMVWSKSVTDTAGFLDFYNRSSQSRSIDNEADAPYFWNTRADVTLVTVDDSAFIKPSKVVSLLQKATKKHWNRGQISDRLHDAARKDASLRVENQRLEENAQQLLKSGCFRPGIYTVALPKGYQVIRVDNVINPSLKSATEARGYYLNDYQALLDSQLIERLRKKYNVVIHQDVLDAITY